MELTFSFVSGENYWEENSVWTLVPSVLWYTSQVDFFPLI